MGLADGSAVLAYGQRLNSREQQKIANRFETVDAINDAIAGTGCAVGWHGNAVGTEGGIEDGYLYLYAIASKHEADTGDAPAEVPTTARSSLPSLWDGQLRQAASALEVLAISPRWVLACKVS